MPPRLARPARSLTPLGAAFAAAWPGAQAWACAVCVVPSRDTAMAFLGTAVLLSVLPLALIGGIGVWLHRRVRRAAHQGPPRPGSSSA